MSAALFVRLLSSDEKQQALGEAVNAVRQGNLIASVTYEVTPSSFAQVPGSPFAYWVTPDSSCEVLGVPKLRK